MTYARLITDDFTGMTVHPDEWNDFSRLVKDDGYKDSSFAGCQYRLPSNCVMGYQLAVNIKVTGRKSFELYKDRYRTRIQIEFVGDGDPSVFARGWMYSDGELIEPLMKTWSLL